MRRTWTRIAALAICASFVVPTLAQQDPNSATPDASAQRANLFDPLSEQRQQQQQLALGPVLSAPFSGGTLREYVATVKKAAGDNAPTVMVRGDADAVTIGAVELSDIQMFSALRLLEGQYITEGGSRYYVSTDNVANGTTSKPAYLVMIQNNDGPSRGTSAAKPQFIVLPVKEITTALPGDPPEVVVPAETVLTAVETALDVAGSGDDKAVMRYHPESGLIILAGPEDALSAAQDVVRQIDSDVRQRRDRARELQKTQGLTNPDALEEQLADARAEAQMAEVRMHAAEQRLQMADQRLGVMQAQADQGVASADELREAKLRLTDADAEVQENRIQVDRARARAEQIGKLLERSKQIASGGAAPGSELQSLRDENAMLRDRVAVLEAQVAKLNSELKGRPGDRDGGRGGAR